LLFISSNQVILVDFPDWPRCHWRL